MIASCGSCGKKYKIDSAKIKGNAARFKCKACGDVITVTKTGGAPTPPRTAVSGAKQPPKKGFIRKEKVDAPVSITTSIRTKITLVIVFLVIVSLGIVGFLASSQSKSALSEQAENHLRKISNQKSSEYEKIFQRINQEMKALVDYSVKILERRDIVTDNGFHNIIVLGPNGPTKGEIKNRRRQILHGEYLKYQRVGELFNSHVASNPYLSLGYVASESIGDSSMMVVSNKKSYEVINSLETYHPQKRPWYIDAKKQKRMIWTDTYVDADTKKLVVTCTAPIYMKDKSEAGVAGFDVLLETIEQDILKLDIGYKDSYAFLVDKQGKVIVKPGMKARGAKWDKSFNTDNLLKSKNKEFATIIRKMIRFQNGIDTYNSIDGEYYISYAPIKTMNASIGIVTPKDAVIKPAVSTQMYIIGASGLVFVIAILVGVLIGNGITKPINELTTMANLISQGKMDLNVLEENRKDEIGILTKSFNRLVISLKLAMSR